MSGKITYKSAGVDIDAGEHAVSLIKDITQRTFSERVLCGIGGFGGLFSVKGLGGDDPVLVSGTDGVGTKLRIAFMLGKHDTIGIDAVAMCVNDVICSGAKPLFFLDYLAVGKLNPIQVGEIVHGVGEGCLMAGCALIGGEMAEMPGFYADGEYDIAGFCVGIVDRSKMIDGSKIRRGDVVIGIPSSGLHSNGYSLVRKVFFDVAHANIDMDATIGPWDDKTLGEILLEPTTIYADVIGDVVDAGFVRGIAHITGGGLDGNVRRIVPDGCSLEIDLDAWKRPYIFDLIQRVGYIEEEEMRRVFNCGIGMVVVVSPDDSEKVIEMIDKKIKGALVIGKIK